MVKSSSLKFKVLQGQEEAVGVASLHAVVCRLSSITSNRLNGVNKIIKKPRSKLGLTPQDGLEGQ